MVNFSRFLATLPILAGLAAAAPAIQSERRDGLAPLKTAGKNAIADSYIVVLNDDVSEDEEMSILNIDLPLGVKHVFKKALKGYAGKFDAETLKKIRANPKVAYVEHDSIMHAVNTQSGAGYGLAISSEQGKLSTSQQSSYYYDNGAGSGVTAYVIDTGINTAHSDFGGRAYMAANYVSGSPNTDENGHGSHCAGTIGGAKYGIAKSVTLAGVKVLGADGSGSTSGIIAAINWVVGDASGPSVISMSLGGGYSASLNSAVRNADANGIPVAVAAGNEDQNACNTSPASEASAITVGAIDKTYTRAYFSNFGSCLDVFAPGVDILSAWIGSSTATNTISGTSMATPHVAGILAYYLSQGASGSGAKSLLSQYADRNYISDVSGSPNLLANNGYWD